ncbi:MAG: YceD family protein [Pseudomonadota bacterium]
MIPPEFSRPFALERLERGPVADAIEADDDERTALAARFDLVALDALTAQLTATAKGDDILLRGELRAVGAQRCVATLDPAPFALVVEIDERFTTRADDDQRAEGEEGDLVALDAPEPVDGDAIDLGELAAQALSLALDPHPRAPDAPNDASYAEADRAPPSPFAKLAALKT